MADIIGKIPEFTQEETVEVKEPVPDPTTEQLPEKETPAPPAEKPTESVETQGEEAPSQDNAIQALQTERVKLLKEISELRGQKREIKQEQLERNQAQIDELKDLHPDDVATIDRVLRAKGFMTKQEADGMFYEAVKNEELNKFLEKYPEYKPENDPGDVNWSSLTREIGLYKMPANPRQVAEILDRAHRAIVKAPTNLQPQRRQVQIAGAGRGGSQPGGSSKSLDSDRRAMLKQGGWSEEEIRKIEKNL